MNTQEKIIKHQGDVVNLIMESIFIPIMKKSKSYCQLCGQQVGLFAEYNNLEEENIALRDRIHKLENELQSQDEEGHD